jgi:hypothetical protein
VKQPPKTPSYKPPTSPESARKQIDRLLDPSLPELTRRRLIAYIGGTLMAGASAYLAPDVFAQANRKLHPWRPGSAPIGAPDPPPDPPPDPGAQVKATLSPSDIEFEGLYRMPSDTSGGMAGGFQKAGWCARVVDGEVHFLGLAGGANVVEFALPAAEPGATVATAPRLTLVHHYGKPWTGITFGGAGGTTAPAAIWWEPSRSDVENRGYLWFSWRDAYTGSAHFASVGCVEISGTTVVGGPYGPWRVQEHPKKTCLGWTDVPEWFQPSVGNRKVAQHYWSQSGIAQSPLGVNLTSIGIEDVTPGVTAADPAGNFPAAYSIPSTRLMMRDLANQQRISGTYRNCSWPGGSSPDQALGLDGLPGGTGLNADGAYMCNYAEPWTYGGPGANPYIGQGRDSQGGAYNSAYFNTPNIPFWGTGSSSVGELNRTQSAVWIDLPDHHGLLVMGYLAINPYDYLDAPGDPDGYVHVWYGDPSHASTRNDGSDTELYGYANHYCCHGQYAPGDGHWNATGPGAHRLTPVGWIYNPNDLLLRVDGPPASLTEYDLEPEHDEFQLRQYFGSWMGSNKANDQVFGVPYVDVANRKLYFAVQQEDSSRPVLCVCSLPT